MPPPSLLPERLARAPRVDGLLVVAGSLALGAVLVVHPIAALCLIASFIIAIRPPWGRDVSRWALLLAIAAGALGAFRARAAISADQRADARALSTLPTRARCAFDAEIDGMPKMRGVLTADAIATSLDCEGAAAGPFRMRLYDVPADVARGDRLAVVADVARARRLRNPELGDASPGEARRNVTLTGSVLVARPLVRATGWVAGLDRARARLRAGLVTVLPADVAPIGRALVLGEEDLAPEDDDAFRRSGLVHLLAVSGSHVALVVLGLVTAVRWLLLRVEGVARRVDVGRLAAAIGIPLAIVYDQLAGDAGAARRATVMAVGVLLVRAACRRASTVRALGASVLVGCLLDPLAPFDLSFSLSIAATVGLLVIAPRLVERMFARWPGAPRPLVVGLAATMGATVACAPLIAEISAQTPVLGVLTNLVAVPIGEMVALPLCNLAALLGAIANGALLAAIARAVGTLAAGALTALRAIALAASNPSFAVAWFPPPTVAELTVVGAMLVALGVARSTRRRAAWLVPATVAALLVCELVHIRAARPHGLLRVTVLDVGQGDATLVDFPDGRAMLVDAGGEVGSPWDPGKAVVAPMLATRRRRALDVVVLSHPHPDHFLGLQAGLDRIDVRELWDTGEGRSHGLGGRYGLLLSTLTERHVALRGPDSLCGEHAIGGARVEVLHPCPGPDSQRSTNDNSFVLRISLGAQRALLVGDAERATEAKLLAERRAQLPAGFLKVGHHGSRTSSGDAFIGAVSPAVAAISCGARNRFGHPSPTTLDTLSRRGARVLRTDRHGAIGWVTNGSHAWLEGAGASDSHASVPATARTW